MKVRANLCELVFANRVAFATPFARPCRAGVSVPAGFTLRSVVGAPVSKAGPPQVATRTGSAHQSQRQRAFHDLLRKQQLVRRCRRTPRPAGHIRRRGSCFRLPPSPSFHYRPQTAARSPTSARRAWKSVPSTQSRCRTTARRRPTAIWAAAYPAVWPTSIPQRFSQFQDRTRQSRTVPASQSSDRTIRSPQRVIPPFRSVSPEAYSRGVSPKCAPSKEDLPSSPRCARSPMCSGRQPGEPCRRRVLPRSAICAAASDLLL